MYSWSRNATGEYGLLADITGANEYNHLTGIDTYAVPNEPAAYNTPITNTTATHEASERKRSGDKH
jgi:hypothetical protein